MGSSEYWNYLDRPEVFAAIPDAETELGRLFAVLRFWFTKDLVQIPQLLSHTAWTSS